MPELESRMPAREAQERILMVGLKAMSNDELMAAYRTIGPRCMELVIHTAEKGLTVEDAPEDQAIRQQTRKRDDVSISASELQVFAKKFEHLGEPELNGLPVTKALIGRVLAIRNNEKVKQVTVTKHRYEQFKRLLNSDTIG